MLELTVYGARNCCLCDRAKHELEPLAAELGLVVRSVEIDGDPELETAWREQIPVGFLDGHKVFKYHVDPGVIRRRAAAARARPAAAPAGA